MTQKDTMTCAHEPFGDAWYFGPERLGERYHKDENRRTKTGFNDVMYRAVLDGFEKDTAQVRCTPPFHNDKANLLFSVGSSAATMYMMRVFDGIDASTFFFSSAW